MKLGKLQIKRAYDPPAKADGCRILVDRLWPRGIKKEDLKLDFWLKEVAPSANLRKWYCHDPEKWAEFQKKYFHELASNQDALEPIIASLKSGTVTLIYGAKDTLHNNAVSLKNFIEKHF